jgi:hypothetical protein
MILQRFLDAVLSALDWLVNLLFPQAALLTVLLCLGLGAFVLAVVWRSRARDGSSAVRPPLADAAPVLRKRDRPRP